jgi:hypothetical protein
MTKTRNRPSKLGHYWYRDCFTEKWIICEIKRHEGGLIMDDHCEYLFAFAPGEINNDDELEFWAGPIEEPKD